MLHAAWGLLRETGRVLLEAAPEGYAPGDIVATITGEPSVASVHDVHVWLITSGFPALSAHVLVHRPADCHQVRRDLEKLLAGRFGLDHTTLQVDHVRAADHPARSALVNMASAEARPGLHQRAIRLEQFSIAWMLIEAGVVVTAGIVARSLALTSFGFDSVIELVSAVLVMRRLCATQTDGQPDDRAERRVLRITSLSAKAAKPGTEN